MHSIDFFLYKQITMLHVCLEFKWSSANYYILQLTRMTKFHEFPKSAHALTHTRTLTHLWIKSIQKTESNCAYLEILLWSMKIWESSESGALCALKTLFHIHFSIIGRIQVMITQKFQRWLHVFLFLNIITTVLSVAWKCYRDMKMIYVFIDDNVLKMAFFFQRWLHVFFIPKYYYYCSECSMKIL